MLKQIEGSRAVAEAVAMCRPQVICAYPITPQALEVIPAVLAGFAAGFGRDSGGLVRPYQTDDAETVVVARTRSRTWPPRPWRTCATWNTRRPGRWTSAAPATCTSWSPARFGWGSSPANTVKVARLATESGLFPVFEAEAGEVTSSTPIRHQVPVTDYLRVQARYAHLFKPEKTKRSSAASRQPPTATSAGSGWPLLVPNGPGCCTRRG